MWKNLIGMSCLIASIALLTHSLSPAQAQPTSSVSLGSNPIFSYGGYCASSQSLTITAQPGQSLVLTDINISAQPNYGLEIIFNSATGAELGRYKAWNYQNYPGVSIVDTHLISGLKAAENEDIIVNINGHGSFSYSGYYAQP